MVMVGWGMGGVVTKSKQSKPKDLADTLYSAYPGKC